MVIVRNDNKPVKYFARVRKVGSLFVRFEVGIETTVHREVTSSSATLFNHVAYWPTSIFRVGDKVFVVVIGDEVVNIITTNWVRDLFHHKLYTFIEQSRLVLDDPIECLLKTTSKRVVRVPSALIPDQYRQLGNTFIVRYNGLSLRVDYKNEKVFSSESSSSSDSEQESLPPPYHKSSASGYFETPPPSYEVAANQRRVHFDPPSFEELNLHDQEEEVDMMSPIVWPEDDAQNAEPDRVQFTPHAVPDRVQSTPTTASSSGDESESTIKSPIKEKPKKEHWWREQHGDDDEDLIPWSSSEEESDDGGCGGKSGRAEELANAMVADQCDVMGAHRIVMAVITDVRKTGFICQLHPNPNDREIPQWSAFAIVIDQVMCATKFERNDWFGRRCHVNITIPMTAQRENLEGVLRNCPPPRVWIATMCAINEEVPRSSTYSRPGLCWYGAFFGDTQDSMLERHSDDVFAEEFMWERAWQHSNDLPPPPPFSSRASTATRSASEPSTSSSSTGHTFARKSKSCETTSKPSTSSSPPSSTDERMADVDSLLEDMADDMLEDTRQAAARERRHEGLED